MPVSKASIGHCPDAADDRADRHVGNLRWLGRLLEALADHQLKGLRTALSCSAPATPRANDSTTASEAAAGSATASSINVASAERSRSRKSPGER